MSNSAIKQRLDHIAHEGSQPMDSDKDSATITTTVIVNSVNEIRPHIAEIEELAAAAYESNVFYEPWMLFESIKQYSGPERLIFLLIYANNSGRQRLCGFFPLMELPHFRNLPLRHLIFWITPHSYSVTPLLHRQHIQEAVNAVLNWFKVNRQYKLLLGGNLTAGSLLRQSLEKAADIRKLNYHSDVYHLPLLRREKDSETYLAQHTSSRFRKDLRNCLRKLERFGKVSYRAPQSDEDIGPWIQTYIEMEAAGWKGSSELSIANSQPAKAFFLPAMREAFARKQLEVVALYLDEKPIAIVMALLSGRGAFGYKRTYDEGYARYSPGTLLDLELIRRLHERTDFKWLDSCTDRDNHAYDRLFNSEKPMQNLAISNGGLLGNLMVRLLPQLRHIKLKLNRRRDSAES